jgi:hypothetical protein
MAEGNTSNGKKSKLETLREKHAQLAAQIAEAKRLESAKARKMDTRLKVVVGAACLADAAMHEDTKAAVRAVLERAVKAPRDRQFLKEQGWLG